MMIRAAVGISSVMTALAQPNQPAVPAGLLCMVQSWTWVKDAAPAITPTDSTMATSGPSVRRAATLVGPVVGVVVAVMVPPRGARRVRRGCLVPRWAVVRDGRRFR